MVVFLILFFTMLLRRKVYGTVAAWLLLFVFMIPGSISSGEGFTIYAMIGAIAFPTIMVLPAARFGVLAQTATIFTIHLFIFFPITTELSAWYAGGFVLCAALLLALAIFGFYTSLAGEKIFETKFLKDIEN